MNEYQRADLYHYICDLQEAAIRMCDARPSMTGGTFRRMRTMAEMQQYLDLENKITRLKKVLRKEVGWWRYYTHYAPKFLNHYNAYYYTRI